MPGQFRLWLQACAAPGAAHEGTILLSGQCACPAGAVVKVRVSASALFDTVNKVVNAGRAVGVKYCLGGFDTSGCGSARLRLDTLINGRRLDKNRFIRVHRSHIINIDRVVGHRRNGDSELVELTATDHYSVPVSRSRIGWPRM